MGLVTPDYGLLFWMVLSFSIVLFVLGKFAWKPILKSLKDREESIEGALQSAEQAKVEMQLMQADNEKFIVEAKVERDNLIKEAREVKDNIIKEAKVQATVEANKLVETARERIQTEKAMALTEIKNQVTLLSVQIAEKILKRELADAKDQQKYIEEMLKEINMN
ncbi:MAG: F0F1 ATP synthase subunit B [Bacteroidales bacterium]|nr:F0F1 ATP synthase subunit B [Bacteroidales bacterium]MCF8456501.1 F0F1 ATP synthase subunit B [Bacteroidales bacterium]